MKNNKDRSRIAEIAVAASAYVEEKKYWMSKLSGDLVKCSFPYDETHDDKRFEQEVFRVEGELFQGLMKLSNNSDANLHMILTAALVVLLYKHTGIKDIILGTPIFKQEVESDFVNTALALRNNIEAYMTFKELLFQVRRTIKEAVENQNYPVELLAEQVGAPCEGETFSLFDTALLLENIHDKTYLSHIDLSMIFSCNRKEESLEISIEYNTALHKKETIQNIGRRFNRLMNVAHNIELLVSEIEILPGDEKKRLLAYTVGPEVEFPSDRLLWQLIREHAEKEPSRLAVICGNDRVTYGELEERSNRLAGYLIKNSIKIEDKVGIMMDRSINVVVAVLAVWKAGGAYIPIDAGLPGKRIAGIIDDACVDMMLSEKKYIKTLNSLQWACKCFHTFLCIDSEDIYSEDEAEKSVLMDPKLWEFIGETAKDDIMGGGWISSYTGNHFSREEVDEFAENLFQKLQPILHKKMRILEIGSASGISMYRIAPLVGYYYGTDISRVIIEKNKARVEKEGYTNIALAAMAAHEIDKIEEKDFDLVIINSVIQDFHGHNYLRHVIRKAVEKLGDKGYIFVGDVMDQDSKAALIEDLTEFKRNNRDKQYKTKLIWDAELFISRGFFEDLVFETPGIRKVEFSNKIYTIENELTKFRYDTFIHVDKQPDRSAGPTLKHKYQHDAGALPTNVDREAISPAAPGNLAYVIYTSGSTGAPKGVLVEHIGMMNHLFAKINALQITRESMVAQNASFAFDISVWQFFSALATGGKTVVYSDEYVLSPDRLITRLIEDRVTILEVVPSYLSLLLDVLELELKPENFDSLKYLLVTGEAVNPGSVAHWFKKYPGIKMVNAYGPTEASDDITHLIMDRAPEGERIPIGKPLQNFRIYIVDNDMNECPIGVKGEICVSGVGVGRGYLGDEIKTKQAFMEDPFIEGETKPRLYKTGDLGSWNPDGNIEFFGRKDYQVKLRGFRIELGEIEKKLDNLPEVKEAVVIDSGNDEGQQYLCAYIVPDKHYVSPEFDVYELKELLQGHLPDYMIPRYFVKMEELPLTPNGKVDRKKLPSPEVKVSSSYMAPGNETEEKLVGILSEVLGINKETIGIDDNIFDLGANSISVLSVQNRINKVFGYDISLSALFLYPTVRGLGVSIHEEKTLNELECVVKLNNGKNKRNIFIIHPLHGMVYQYKALAELLKDHFNVYGIQARGVASNNRTPEDIDMMVDDYFDQIKVVQPEGPYILSGYCVGTIIGYELVKKLERINDEVEMFILFDHPPFMPLGVLKYLRFKEKIRSIMPFLKIFDRSKLKKKYIAEPVVKPEIKSKFEEVTESILKGEVALENVLEHFQDKGNEMGRRIRNVKLGISGIVKADLFVITARETDWKRLGLNHYKHATYGNAAIEVTGGDHNSMFYPPHVKGLSEILIDHV